METEVKINIRTKRFGIKPMDPEEAYCTDGIIRS